MKTIILAAGNQKRWGEYPIKQLLPIGNMTIIERTVKMCNDRGFRPTIATHRTEFDYLEADIFKPHDRRYTVDTLFSTCFLWDDRTCILLGDVIYSHNILDMTFGCQDKFRAFGNEWEIFSLSFSDKVKTNVLQKLLDTIRQAENGKHKGTLRNFCQNLFGVEGPIHHLPHFTKICHFNDYTNDVDSPEEYENFLKQHLNSMLQDDR